MNTKPFAVDRLGILIDVFQRGRAALGDGAEGFFGDRGQSTLLIAHRGIVVELSAEQADVPLPPADAFEQLVGHFFRAGAAGEQVFGAKNLRSLRKNGGSAAGDNHVGCVAEGRVGRDSRVAIRSAAVGSQHDFAGRDRLAPHVIDTRQQLGDAADAHFDGFGRAPQFLHDQHGGAAARTLPVRLIARVPGLGSGG